MTVTAARMSSSCMLPASNVAVRATTDDADIDADIALDISRFRSAQPVRKTRQAVHALYRELWRPRGLIWRGPDAAPPTETGAVSPPSPKEKCSDRLLPPDHYQSTNAGELQTSRATDSNKTGHASEVSCNACRTYGANHLSRAGLTKRYLDVPRVHQLSLLRTMTGICRDVLRW
jgi:hypothetical protein